MSVESFDPGAQAPTLDEPTLARLLEAAAAEPPHFGLDRLERERFAGYFGSRPRRGANRPRTSMRLRWWR